MAKKEDRGLMINKYCTCKPEEKIGHTAGTIMDGSRFGKDEIICLKCHRKLNVYKKGDQMT